MANAKTILRNITANPIGLPMPYKGMLYANNEAFLQDDLATVVANLGGSQAMKGTFVAQAVPTGSTIPVSYHDGASPSKTGFGSDPSVDYANTGKAKGPISDGTNSPTVTQIDFIDQVTGLRKHVTVNSGVVTVS